MEGRVVHRERGRLDVVVHWRRLVLDGMDAMWVNQHRLLVLRASCGGCRGSWTDLDSKHGGHGPHELGHDPAAVRGQHGHVTARPHPRLMMVQGV